MKRLTPVEVERAKLLIRARAIVNVEIADLRLERKNGFIPDIVEAFDSDLQAGKTLPSIDIAAILRSVAPKKLAK